VWGIMKSLKCIILTAVLAGSALLSSCERYSDDFWKEHEIAVRSHYTDDPVTIEVWDRLRMKKIGGSARRTEFFTTLKNSNIKPEGEEALYDIINTSLDRGYKAKWVLQLLCSLEDNFRLNSPTLRMLSLRYAFHKDESREEFVEVLAQITGIRNPLDLEIYTTALSLDISHTKTLAFINQISRREREGDKQYLLKFFKDNHDGKGEDRDWFAELDRLFP